jgi:thiol-disulfide isomerase/thioredoxin
MTRPARVRAPQLTGRGGWLNTDHPLSLAALRGRFVLLDFWTFACLNCLHVIDELRDLEQRYADVLTVVGIHSPKFSHEGDHAAVAAAVARYEIHHPVLDDPDLTLWDQYAVRAWPTLVLIDPEGYVIAQAAGEGQVSGLALILDGLIASYEAKGALQRGELAANLTAAGETALRFPAKAIRLPSARTGRATDSVLVADAGHHQVVELALDLVTVLRRIGTGIRGHADGPATDASFAEPGGLTLLPAGMCPYDVVVADTANHLLRGIDLATGSVVATVDLAAELADARTIAGPVPAVLSPWDVAWWPARSRLVVAAAGVHLLLSCDPRTGAVEILAGTTVEGLRDGPALDTWLAQPSGLAVDGDRMWFVDAETSSLRYLQAGTATQPSDQVHTAVGTGLFDFGNVDGPAAQARFQHPLGVIRLEDATVAVLDTYNGAVRHFDPASAQVSTLATGLDEPSGAVLIDSQLVVVESGAHRLIPIAGEPHASATGRAEATQRRPTVLAPGAVQLDIVFSPPPGRKLDQRDGPATRLAVSASPPELLIAGAGNSTELHRELTLSGGAGVLHITAQAAACDDDPSIEHPACHLARQDWGVPVQVTPEGAQRLELMLLG